MCMCRHIWHLRRRLMNEVAIHVLPWTERLNHAEVERILRVSKVIPVVEEFLVYTKTGSIDGLAFDRANLGVWTILVFSAQKY